MYLGDYKEDYADLNFKFKTRDSGGAPITLAGTPTLAVYKSNNLTQSTAGITLTVDFDSATGLHNVKIDLSSDAFYAIGNDYAVVVTAGTVDGVSVVGEVLAHFSIENRFEEVDVTRIGGGAIPTPGITGVPDVNITHINDSPATSSSITDVYTAEVKFWQNSSVDRYSVVWKKNGVPVTPTSPDISAVEIGGSVLFTEQAMIQQGTTNGWYKNESTNRLSDGGQAVVTVTATIDGNTRTEIRIVGRDV